MPSQVSTYVRRNAVLQTDAAVTHLPSVDCVFYSAYWTTGGKHNGRAWELMVQGAQSLQGKHLIFWKLEAEGNLGKTAESLFVAVLGHRILPWHSSPDRLFTKHLGESTVIGCKNSMCNFMSVSWPLGQDLQLCLLGSLWIASAQTEYPRPWLLSGIFCQILCISAATLLNCSQLHFSGTLKLSSVP